MSPTFSFNAASRDAALAEMSRLPLDLLVIGGGITGAGLARDAALRGLRVGLVEAHDFAFGTSSRSTKIVHGGIRYLAMAEMGLVRESARERWVLRRVAPHLVHPLEFVYPLYADQWRLKYDIGFWLYDRLAGARADERHRMLDARQVRARVPGLRRELRGGGLYPEFVTDDARLTLENAMSAAEHGALVVNHAPVEQLLVTNGRLIGARVRDALGGGELEVQARVSVNATGVWAERTLRRGATAPSGTGLRPSKGIHLLFRHERLPLDSASHLRAPDGREGLAIRRLDHVYVGTSDVEYHGSLDRPVADEAAIEDVLHMTRTTFPGLALDASDVIGTWAGVRPLIAETGRSTRETSRHDEIWESPEGLLTIVGGKLTTYRAMGHRVMERVCRRLGRDPGPDRTTEVRLPGAESDIAVDEMLERLDARLLRADVDDRTRRRLLWLYGPRCARLLDYADDDASWLAPLAPGTPAVRAEARLAVEDEMALSLEDFLDRRSSLLLFSDDHGLAAASEAAAILGSHLGWDDARARAETQAYAELARHHGPIA